MILGEGVGRKKSKHKKEKEEKKKYLEKTDKKIHSKKVS